jgi:hypothetical protein
MLGDVVDTSVNDVMETQDFSITTNINEDPPEPIDLSWLNGMSRIVGQVVNLTEDLDDQELIGMFPSDDPNALTHVLYIHVTLEDEGGSAEFSMWLTYLPADTVSGYIVAQDIDEGWDIGTVTVTPAAGGPLIIPTTSASIITSTIAPSATSGSFAVNVGDVIVVTTYNGFAQYVASDNFGNSYTTVVTGSSSNNSVIGFFYATSSTAGNCQLTLSAVSSNQNFWATIQVYSGVKSVGVNTGSITFADAAYFVTSPLTVNTNDVIVAGFVVQCVNFSPIAPVKLTSSAPSAIRFFINNSNGFTGVATVDNTAVSDGPLIVVVFTNTQGQLSAARGVALQLIAWPQIPDFDLSASPGTVSITQELT